MCDLVQLSFFFSCCKYNFWNPDIEPLSLTRVKRFSLLYTDLVWNYWFRNRKSFLTEIFILLFKIITERREMFLFNDWEIIIIIYSSFKKFYNLYE